MNRRGSRTSYIDIYFIQLSYNIHLSGFSFPVSASL